MRLMHRAHAAPGRSRWDYSSLELTTGLLFLGADNRGVRTWEEEVLVSRVAPSDKVRRLSVRVTEFQHLAIPIGLSHPTPTDQDPVPNFCVHADSLPRPLHLAPWSSDG